MTDFKKNDAVWAWTCPWIHAWIELIEGDWFTVRWYYHRSVSSDRRPRFSRVYKDKIHTRDTELAGLDRPPAPVGHAEPETWGYNAEINAANRAYSDWIRENPYIHRQ